jgi:hypothetical protein
MLPTQYSGVIVEGVYRSAWKRFDPLGCASKLQLLFLIPTWGGGWANNGESKRTHCAIL